MDDLTSDSLPAPEETPYEVVFCRDSPGPRPRTTVAISLYKYEHYIGECLESVRHQTIEDLDLLVVDDCSPDRSVPTTVEWMEAHWRRFRRCELIRNITNQGLARNRNLAFERAATEFIFVLDADNTIFPRCIASLSDALARCDASFAYGYLEKFGAERGIVSWKPWNRNDLRYCNTIDAMALVRKAAWEQVGGYSTDMKLGWEDWEFWLKIGDQGGWGLLVPEFLARYRVHPSSMLRTLTNVRNSQIWDYLERKHPDVRRSVEYTDVSYREQDEVRGCCERVRRIETATGSDVVEVRGWALARMGIAHVEVFVDGIPVGRARYGDLRPDLRHQAVGYQNGIRCGFLCRAELPASAGHEAAERDVMVRVTGTSGRCLDLHEVLTMEGSGIDDHPTGCDAHVGTRPFARGEHLRPPLCMTGQGAASREEA